MKQPILGLLLRPIGVHTGAWRLPSSDARASMDLHHYVAIAQAAEAAKLDLLFMPDNSGINFAAASSFERTAAQADAFEPLTLLSALAAVTRSIGLIGTVSVAQFTPHQVARQMLSLDHLSQGRAGWNAVTSPNMHEARAGRHGEQALQTHLSERYAHAAEFIEVVTRFWDAWAADTIVADKDSGLYLRTDRIAPVDFAGRYWAAKGAINAPRSPQERPIIAQAGSSPEGRELAAGSADVVFTVQADIMDAKAFYADVKQRARAHGRKGGDMAILPGLQPIIGATRAEAEALRDKLNARLPIESGLAMLTQMFGGAIDFATLPLEGPIPELVVDRSLASSGHIRSLIRNARARSLSVRELSYLVAGARGHLQVVGTAEDVADLIEEWIDQEAADGFVIMLPSVAEVLEPFTQGVVPILRSRGRLRAEYAGRTLREHLALPAPRRLSGASTRFRTVEA